MWKLLSVFLLLLPASRFDAQGPAQPEGEQARILTLENAWNQSVQQKDQPIDIDPALRPIRVRRA